MNKRLPLLLYGLIPVLLLAMGTGCSSCGADKEDAPPWLFASESAPYEMIFPAQWSREPQGSINPHADIAAHRNDELFLMVIPQQLPDFPRPDLHQFKRTAVELLDESVDEFVVHRQGPLELDGVEAITIIAEGSLDGDPIRYLNSYAVQNDLGFQIIAFAQKEYEELLLSELDLILSDWRFTIADEI